VRFGTKEKDTGIYTHSIYENISCFGIINMFGMWRKWNKIICDTVILLYKNIYKIKFSIF
jgi:hypothetical protein